MFSWMLTEMFMVCQLILENIPALVASVLNVWFKLTTCIFCYHHSLRDHSHYTHNFCRILIQNSFCHSIFTCLASQTVHLHIAVGVVSFTSGMDSPSTTMRFFGACTYLQPPNHSLQTHDGPEALKSILRNVMKTSSGRKFVIIEFISLQQIQHIIGFPSPL